MSDTFAEYVIAILRSIFSSFFFRDNGKTFEFHYDFNQIYLPKLYLEIGTSFLIECLYLIEIPIL